MSSLTLADELALLSYDVDGRSQVGRPTLDYALAGAVVLELTLAGRLDLADGRVRVADPAPTGHPVLDAALSRAADERRPQKPKDLVNRLSKGLLDQVLDGLVAAGVLERRQERVLGLIPRTRFPSPHGVEPQAETEARQRLTAAVLADGPVEPRTAALCGLVRAAGMERKVFPDQSRRQVNARLAEISAGDWASDATRRVIQEMQAATIAAITAATVASTTSASS
ncbi:GPP34 family phosphoprotein [Plantactinospora siamensis]|uniref:GPP34 family phosphoprotein n=1 Tax=Plantactinospora siamensis TaxID=555372 RepID=A0ABV6NR01_9ACTN